MNTIHRKNNSAFGGCQKRRFRTSRLAGLWDRSNGAECTNLHSSKDNTLSGIFNRH